MGSIGRTGGLSSGIPVDMIGRIPFIVLHDGDGYYDDYSDQKNDHDEAVDDEFKKNVDLC